MALKPKPPTDKINILLLRLSLTGTQKEWLLRQSWECEEALRAPGNIWQRNAHLEHKSILVEHIEF